MDRARVAAGVVSLALIAATLEPLVREPYDDGFPLSTYPMFATKRPTVQTFHYALGLTRDGKRRTLVVEWLSALTRPRSPAIIRGHDARPTGQTHR